MIDIHSHVIPGIDDGAKNEEMAIEMLKIAEKSGTRKLVVTPHFMRGRFNYEYNEVTEEVDNLKKIAEENKIHIEIYQGQEIYYSENILKYFNEGIIGTINGSRYMLIEFPMLEFNLDKIIDNLYELQIKGIVPIIAHPERYKPFMKKPSLINELIKEGCLFQLNAGSLTGEFGKDVKKIAELYYENKIYNFVGSDAHRADRRNPDLNEFHNMVDKENIKFLIQSSEAMLNNEKVDFEGNMIKERKKFLGLF